MKEIEWRFLITKLPKIPPVKGERLRQAYLTQGDPAIRVRIYENSSEVTIKYRAQTDTAKDGPSEREEYNASMDREEAESLFARAEASIDKTRYRLDGNIELDVFHGPHEGLVLAEIEVPQADAEPLPPEGWQWLEISSDYSLSNQSLAWNGIPDSAEMCVIEKE